MLYLALSIVAIGIVTALIGWFSFSNNGEPTIVKATVDCATCDGENSKCEMDCMAEAAVKEIEYFDDEELDAYALFQ